MLLYGECHDDRCDLECFILRVIIVNVVIMNVVALFQESCFKKYLTILRIRQGVVGRPIFCYLRKSNPGTGRTSNFWGTSDDSLEG